jgi:hypothetical protein
LSILDCHKEEQWLSLASFLVFISKKRKTLHTMAAKTINIHGKNISVLGLPAPDA